LQIEPEEFRRRYAELSDEALLEIDRHDLTEIGLQFYDAEVANRGIESTAASGDPESSPDAELVPVAGFRTVDEGEIARELLRAADIPAYLEDELPPGLRGVGMRPLMVPASFFEQAKEILEAPPISDEELIAQAEAADPVDTDPDEEPG
jgi:hypothetical protein